MYRLWLKTNRLNEIIQLYLKVVTYLTQCPKTEKNTTLFRQVIRFGEAAFKPVIVAMINQPLNIAFFLLSLHNVFFISFWGRTTKTGGCKFTVVEFIERKIWIFGPLNKKQKNTVFPRLRSNFQLLLVNE